jgi:hypothetical protein
VRSGIARNQNAVFVRDDDLTAFTVRDRRFGWYFYYTRHIHRSSHRKWEPAGPAQSIESSFLRRIADKVVQTWKSRNIGYLVAPCALPAAPVQRPTVAAGSMPAHVRRRIADNVRALKPQPDINRERPCNHRWHGRSDSGSNGSAVSRVWYLHDEGGRSSAPRNGNASPARPNHVTISPHRIPIGSSVVGPANRPLRSDCYLPRAISRVALEADSLRFAANRQAVISTGGSACRDGAQHSPAHSFGLRRTRQPAGLGDASGIGFDGRLSIALDQER